MRRVTKLLPVLMAVTLMSTGCSLGAAADIAKIAYGIATTEKETTTDSAEESSLDESTDNSIVVDSGDAAVIEDSGSEDASVDTTENVVPDTMDDSTSADSELPATDDQNDSNTDSADSDSLTPGSATGARIGVNAYTGGSNATYNTIVQVSDETLAEFNSLESDINKIKWFYIGTLEGEENIVVSYAPFYDGYYYHYLIALTNLNNYTTDINMTGYAEDADGNNVGNLYVGQYGVGAGSTYIQDVYLDDLPSGILNIDELTTSEPHENYVYWEADWSLGVDDTKSLAVKYNIYSAETMVPGYIYAVLLDADGYIINSARDYITDATTSYTGELSYYKSEFERQPKDVAFFANPTDGYYN